MQYGRGDTGSDCSRGGQSRGQLTFYNRLAQSNTNSGRLTIIKDLGPMMTMAFTHCPGHSSRRPGTLPCSRYSRSPCSTPGSPSHICSRSVSCSCSQGLASWSSLLFSSRFSCLYWFLRCFVILSRSACMRHSFFHHTLSLSCLFIGSLQTEASCSF